MGNRLKKDSINIMLFFLIVGISASKVIAQEEIKKDTTRANVVYHQPDSLGFARDTIEDQNDDVSPLDIGGGRGIFILSADRMLQLRLLGSIRTSINYSDQAMSDNQTFNPYEIPTEVNTNSPNFFAGLQQTRLGIEVTRRTKKRGDVFIRFEGDFKNSSTTLRIRHAYGQIGKFLLGQTWSLMNNVTYQPAIVSLDGPADGSGLRTPQIRFTKKIDHKTAWAAAVEYSAPDIQFPDSTDVTILQVIPNITARYTYNTEKLSFRVSSVISTISGRVESEDISYAFGYGGSFAGMAKTSAKGNVYLSISAGKAVAHFLDTFSGKNEDMAYDPETNRFYPLNVYGGYVAYSHDLPQNFSTSLSFGSAAITNLDFQEASAYSWSYNTLLNVFWQPIDGARLGIEFATGQRVDKGGDRGRANRLSMLMYYDF